LSQKHFFNDFDPLFNAFAANKFIFKKNYVLQWGILQNLLQPKFCLPAPIQTQPFVHSAIPWTCTTYQIHSLFGRILNITLDRKRPYVKVKVNGNERNFLYDTGPSRTCMILNTFCNAFQNGTPRRLNTNSIRDDLYDAGGKPLGCLGVYETDFEVMGR
jgi:hypothetical protein